MTVAVRRLLAALLGAVWLLAVGAVPAGAHATLVAVRPADEKIVESSPARVTLVFSEPVEAAFGAMRVLDPAGRPVDLGATRVAGRTVSAALPGDLGQGTYTVAWRVVSADSHPVRGASVFSVGQVSGGAAAGAAFSDDAVVTRPLQTAVRAVDYAAMVVLVGAVAFLPLVWRHASVPQQVAGDFARRYRRLWQAALAALAVTTPALLVLQAGVASGVAPGAALSPVLLTTVLFTRFGALLAVRAILTVFLAVVLPALRPDRPVRPAWWAAAVGLSAGLLAATSAWGHAGATPPVTLVLGLHWLHMVAASVWVGGLVVLAGVLLPVARGELGTPVLAATVPRFSQAATACVAVLVATGVAQTWVHLGALDQFTSTGWGLALTGKLVLFAPLLALGAYNQRVAVPRLARAAAPAVGAMRATDAATLPVRRAVWIEIAVSAAILAVVAVLVSLPPARVEAGEPVAIRATFPSGALLDVTVDPARAGRNVLHVYVLTPGGRRDPDADHVALAFRLPSQDLGPLRDEPTPAGDGHFTSTQVLPVPGTWQLTVTVHRPQFTTDEVTVTTPVR